MQLAIETGEVRDNIACKYVERVIKVRWKHAVRSGWMEYRLADPLDSMFTIALPNEMFGTEEIDSPDMSCRHFRPILPPDTFEVVVRGDRVMKLGELMLDATIVGTANITCHSLRAAQYVQTRTVEFDGQLTRLRGWLVRRMENMVPNEMLNLMETA